MRARARATVIGLTLLAGAGGTPAAAETGRFEAITEDEQGVHLRVSVERCPTPGAGGEDEVVPCDGYGPWRVALFTAPRDGPCAPAERRLAWIGEGVTHLSGEHREDIQLRLPGDDPPPTRLCLYLMRGGSAGNPEWNENLPGVPGPLLAETVVTPTSRTVSMAQLRRALPAWLRAQRLGAPAGRRGRVAYRCGRANARQAGCLASWRSGRLRHRVTVTAEVSWDGELSLRLVCAQRAQRLRGARSRCHRGDFARAGLQQRRFLLPTLWKRYDLA